MAKAQAKPTFASILDAPATEFEAPKAMPVGSYVVVVSGLPRIDKSSKKQTEFVEFTLNIQSALDDVEPDELKEMGGVAGKTIKDTYYITDNSAYRLKETLVNMGIDIEGKSFRAMLDETPGKTYIIVIGHEPTDDGRIFARVKRTLPVE
jgi:hypothetical protein